MLKVLIEFPTTLCVPKRWVSGNKINIISINTAMAKATSHRIGYLSPYSPLKCTDLPLCSQTRNKKC